MWKFIMIAMFYSPSGQMLQEFPTPMSVNTEATCRAMMTRYTQSKKNVVKNGKKYQLEVKTDCVFDPEPTTKTASTPDANTDAASAAPAPPVGAHANASPAAGTPNAPRVIPLYKTVPEAGALASTKADEPAPLAPSKSPDRNPTQLATTSPTIIPPTRMRDPLSIPRDERQPSDVAKQVDDPKPIERVKPVEAVLPEPVKRAEQGAPEPLSPVEYVRPTSPRGPRSEVKEPTPTVGPSAPQHPLPAQRVQPEPQVIPRPREASREPPRQSGQQYDRQALPRDYPNDPRRFEWRQRASREDAEDVPRQRRAYEQRRLEARRHAAATDFPVGGFFSEPPPPSPIDRRRFEREFEDEDFSELRQYRRRGGAW